MRVRERWPPDWHHCRPHWRNREKRFARMSSDWRRWRRLQSPRYHRHLRKARGGTMKGTAAVAPQKKRMSAGVPVVSRTAPFVLTGTEQRGGRTYAAVAPVDLSSLADVTLLGEGESTTGWVLERAGRGEATFRVNGRQVRVMVE